MQRNLKAVFFDFDGTLVYLPINYNRLRYRLRKLFFPYGIISNFKPLFFSIEECLIKMKQKKYTETCINKIRIEANSIVVDEELISVKTAKLCRYCNEILHFLKKRRIKIVIVSRNSRKCINLSISRLKIPRPHLIVSRDDVKNMKPNPEHFLKPLRKLRFSKDNVLIVGDSFHDIEGGKQTGIKTILVTHSRITRMNIKSTYTIKELDGILSCINNSELVF